MMSAAASLGMIFSPQPRHQQLFHLGASLSRVLGVRLLRVWFGAALPLLVPLLPLPPLRAAAATAATSDSASARLKETGS